MAKKISISLSGLDGPHGGVLVAVASPCDIGDHAAFMIRCPGCTEPLTLAVMVQDDDEDEG